MWDSSLYRTSIEFDDFEMSSRGVQTPAHVMTPHYKATFPAAWITSTAQSRSIDESTQGRNTDGTRLPVVVLVYDWIHSQESNMKVQIGPSNASLRTPEVRSEMIRESLPPAALFLHEAGLVTPTTPTSTITDTSRKRRKVPSVDIHRRDTNSEASVSTAIASSKTHGSQPDAVHAKAYRMRAAVKKFLPKFKSERTTSTNAVPAPRTAEEKGKGENKRHPLPPVSSRPHPVPTQRPPFRWPESPVILQHQGVAELQSVPEGSPTRLTADSLDKTVGQTSSTMALHAGINRSPAPNIHEPMTAGTGISSRSSNYADVPSRLPRFSPGYSPLSWDRSCSFCVSGYRRSSHGMQCIFSNEDHSVNSCICCSFLISIFVCSPSHNHSLLFFLNTPQYPRGFIVSASKNWWILSFICLKFQYRCISIEKKSRYVHIKKRVNDFHLRSVSQARACFESWG